MTDDRQHLAQAGDCSTDQQMKRLVQDQFSRNASNFVTSPAHRAGPDLPVLIEWLCPQQDWTTLDVATGGGHVAKVLSPYVRQVFATDLTPAMLAAARGHLQASGCGNVAYVIADAEDLPFLDDSFDAVTCRIAPHHFPHPDRFVQEVARVLKPGGRFVLIDNVAPEDPLLADFINTVERLRDPSHVRCANIEEWQAWFGEAGLTVMRHRARRKVHRFQPWMERIGASDAQIRAIETYVQSAPETCRSHFAIQIEDGHIVTIEGEEWMALAVRSPRI